MMWYHIIGFIGVALVLLTYLLLQAGKLETNQPLYPILNIIASTLVLFTTYWEFSIPTVVLQVGWIVVAIHALIKIYRTKGAKT